MPEHPAGVGGGARPQVAPLLLALLAAVLVGCSGSSGGTTPDSSGDTGSPTTASSAGRSAVDPAAQRAVDRAVNRTLRLHSYAFRATTTVAAKQTADTAIFGRVVRGQGLAYELRTAHRRTEVVRVHAGTYVRRVHGSWARLAHPHAVANPTATLVSVLRGLRATDIAPAAQGSRRVHGTLAMPAAKRAGIPADRQPARVTLTLDRQGRVVGLSISTSTAAGASSVTVTVHSLYGRFGRAHPVRKPV